MNELTELQRDIVGFLRVKQYYRLAESAENCWKKGETFYIDSRVGIKGIARQISKANNEIPKNTN